MIVLTVDGRADSRSDFESKLSVRLADGFNIYQIIPLSRDAEGKRFLAYVASEDEEMGTNDDRIIAILEFLSDIEYNAVAHENNEAAVEWADEQYADEAYSAFTTPVTSKEVRDRDTFVLLIKNNEVTIFRALFHGKPVLCMTQYVHGEAPGDQVAHPLAILVNDEIADEIELPVKSSYEE